MEECLDHCEVLLSCCVSVDQVTCGNVNLRVVGEFKAARGGCYIII